MKEREREERKGLTTDRLAMLSVKKLLEEVISSRGKKAQVSVVPIYLKRSDRNLCVFGGVKNM